MHSNPNRLQIFAMIRRASEPVLMEHKARLYRATSYGPSSLRNARIGVQCSLCEELPLFLTLYAGDVHKPDDLTHFQLVSYRYDAETLIGDWVFEHEVVDLKVAGEISDLEGVIREKLPRFYREALRSRGARRWRPFDPDQKILRHGLTYQIFKMAKQLASDKRWNLGFRLGTKDHREIIDLLYKGEEICGIDVTSGDYLGIFGSFEQEKFHDTSTVDDVTRCHLERCIQSGINAYEEYLALDTPPTDLNAA